MWSSPVESTGVHLKISPPVSNPPQETQSTGLQVDSVGEGKVLINRLSTQSTGLQWTPPGLDYIKTHKQAKYPVQWTPPGLDYIKTHQQA